MAKKLSKKRRDELFIKLNRVNVMIAKNAVKIDQGKDLTSEDWKEVTALFNECVSAFDP